VKPDLRTCSVTTACLFAALLLATAPAQAQMKFLESGHNALVVGTEGLVGPTHSGLGLFVGHTIGDRVDLGLTWRRVSLEWHNGNHTRVTSLAPRVAVSLGASPLSTFGAEISLEVERAYFDDDGFNIFSSEHTTDSVTALVSAYARLEASPEWVVVPQGCLGYFNGMLRNLPEKSVSRSDYSSPVIGVSAGLQWRGRLLITPALMVIERKPNWSLSVGVMVWSRPVGHPSGHAPALQRARRNTN
jgi:hypothetical protein